MATNAFVQAQVDPTIKEQAAAVLERMGLTLADAVTILLTRTATEGALPFSLTETKADYDAWFIESVQQALNDRSPAIAHEEVKKEFAERRATTRTRIQAIA